MRLDLGDFCIRSFGFEDAEALVRQANNRKIWLQVRDRFPHPYTLQDAEAWLSLAATLDPETSFCLATDHELIGGIGLELQEDVYRHSAELGYWLGEPFWGRGIASRAVRAFVQWGFDEFDLHRIFAFVFETNPASLRVLQKAGFSIEGRMRKGVIKDERVIDQHMLSILRSEASG